MELAFAGRTLFALAVIGAILFGLQYVAKLGLRRRLTAPLGGGRLVTILETTYLPSAASLHVVRIGDTYAVVGRSAGFIAKIADVSPDTIGNWRAGRCSSRSA
jgi:flagellar biogenesis protein FliO